MIERKFKRHAPRQEISVWLNLSSGGHWFIGRLADISRAGLGFEYVALNEKVADFPAKDCTILLKAGTLTFPLSATVVYDRVQGSPFILEMRRCGLLFKQMLSEDELNLAFI